MNRETGNNLSLSVPAEFAGQRLDQVLAEMLPDYSRSQIQKWIRDGLVLVDALPLRPRDKLKGGEQVSVQVPEVQESDWVAEDIPLEVVYEDADLLVINKPAGLVVHPAAGNWEGTLLNALINRAPELRALARAGIVHRLDKETSGLMVVARNDRTRLALIEQLQERSVTREYLAVVCGVLVAGGTVDAPIDRHPITGVQQHNVTRNQLLGGKHLRRSVPAHLRFGREHLPQCCQRLLGPVLLIETEQGVDHHHDQNHQGILELTNSACQQRGADQYQNQESLELITQQQQRTPGRLFDQTVGTISAQTMLRFNLA